MSTVEMVENLATNNRHSTYKMYNKKYGYYNNQGFFTHLYQQTIFVLDTLC